MSRNKSDRNIVQDTIMINTVYAEGEMLLGVTSFGKVPKPKPIIKKKFVLKTKKDRS